MTRNVLLVLTWQYFFCVWLALTLLAAILFLRIDRKNKRVGETWVGIVLLVLTSWFGGDILYKTIWPPSWPPDHVFYGDKLENLPNYLVFLATAISAYFIYRTLNNQRRANQVAAFENRFFKFLDYHRENVQQLSYKDPKDKEGNRYFHGNQVFTVIYYEMRDLLLELLEYRKQKRKNILPEAMRDYIDFVYQCVLYGATKDGMPVLEKAFKDRRQVYFSLVNFKERNASYPALPGEDLPKYYSGHIRHLGHYFRNIFQAVIYLEGQGFLTEKEKYDYMRILRAQMSLYEQLVFFFSSLSELGETWEGSIYRRPLPGKGKARIRLLRKLWITKYDMVRNLFDSDGALLKELNVMKFYPLITMERRHECAVHGPLVFKDAELNICRYCFNERYIGYRNEEWLDAVRRHYETREGRAEFESFECDEDCPTKDWLAFQRNCMGWWEYQWGRLRRFIGQQRPRP